MAGTTGTYLRALAACAVVLAALQPLPARACCEKAVAGVAPTPQVVCGSAVATVTFAASAVTTATPDPTPPKPDVGGKVTATGDKTDGLPPWWVSARVAALAAAGLFLLLGMVLLGMALGGRERIQFHVPLTFGGRGYGWEASRSLGLLASSAVCSLLAVLLLLQLVNGVHSKADPPRNDKPASSTAAARTSGN